jgi:uncharacterized protein (TIGR00290 family)
VSDAREKVVFVWSGGKDSALALYKLQRDERYEVVGLLTTCNQEMQRVSMHGVRLELLDMQAESIGLPLEKMFVGTGSSNDAYLEALTRSLLAHKARGVTAFAFGDIFLEDLKAWREEHLASLGLRGVFPLWKRDTRELIEEFMALGFGSIVCCVDDAYLDETALGRPIDAAFLASLPAGVDPCGENGEFHSFAFAGPIFRRPISVTVGERVYKPIEETHPGSSLTKGFWFCDLLPAVSPVTRRISADAV